MKISKYCYRIYCKFNGNLEIFDLCDYKFQALLKIRDLEEYFSVIRKISPRDYCIWFEKIERTTIFDYTED